MVDLLNKIETDLESKTPNILEENVDNTQENTQNNSNQVNLIDNKDNLQIQENVSLDNMKNIEDFSIETKSKNPEVVNCLALTLKKDYNLAIVKNVVVKAFKNVWRVALSIFTLNFLKFFL